MTHGKAGILRWSGLAGLVIAAAVSMLAIDASGSGSEQALVGTAGTVPACDTLVDAKQPDADKALETDAAKDLLEPTAICRIYPECWQNSDCDFKCGAGQGRCVHNKCPVRICKC
jgi:hypothetical protein